MAASKRAGPSDVQAANEQSKPKDERCQSNHLDVVGERETVEASGVGGSDEMKPADCDEDKKGNQA